METKTYFASSVPAAMEVARKELGAEAMLLNSRPAPEEARSLGRLEVTFAYSPERLPQADAGATAEFALPLYSPPAPPAPPPAPKQQARQAAGESPFSVLRSFTPGGARPPAQPQDPGFAMALLAASAAGGPPPKLVGESASPFANLRSLVPPAARPQSPQVSELDDIRAQLKALRSAIDRNAIPVSPVPGPGPDLSGVVARLCARGLDASTARDIAADAALHPEERGSALSAAIVRRIAVEPFGEIGDGARRVLAFVGPAGRGKTTSLVKIAVAFGLAKRIPVRIYCAGPHGVGCQEQMARYASILGVPYQWIENLDSLDLTLRGDAWKGLVLIDTPGLSGNDPAEISGLSQFVSRNPEIETHLVLRADSTAADMRHMTSRFGVLGRMRLLFTGLDEAIGLGAAVDTLIRTGLPATFVGTGLRIPGNIEEIDLDKVTRALCGDSAMAAAAAA